ncbi:MAG: hypothetical protein ABFD54_15390 [Armatimonadota bacterium]|nr:DUF4900 domain-containing protein [bacterium]
MARKECSLNIASYPRSIKRKKGAMLLLMVGALFLITLLTVAVLTVTTGSIYSNNKQQYRAIALNIAESGAEVAALWLRDQAYPPTQTTAFDPLGGVRSLGGGTYSVTITPDLDNNSVFLKTYRIVSIGSFSGASKSVEVVVRQASFGRFAYFTDSECSSVDNDQIWWKAGEVVDGPIHSNNSNKSNFNINYNGSKSPIFQDIVTAAGPTINYTPSRPKNEDTFKRVFKNGSKGYKLGVPRIELPPSTDAQRNAAWGNSAGLPSTTGVYMRADSDGGIYIVGDSAIHLAVDNSGNQQIVVTQVVKRKTQVTTITMDKQSGATTVTGPVGAGSSTSSTTWPNGVVYTTGNITSLDGVVADNKVYDGEIEKKSEITIATDVNAGKDINVTGNIKYNTRPDKTKDSDDPSNLAAGTLGLVARDIIIDSSAPQNLEIDAVCLAGGQNTTDGSFFVENYSSKKPIGTLTVLGGIIQKSRGPVGTFDPDTGKTTSGYAKNYSYDPRLAQTPPPFYPTTGQYDRLSWRILPDN